MTIEKGRPWGEPIERPSDAPVARDDIELARLAAAAVARGERPVIAFEPSPGRDGAGDVARTLGVDGVRPPDEQLGFGFDLGYLRCGDDEPVPFVAHVAMRRPLWRGEFAVVMNAAWVGEWYLGPRAHPNDGLLDVTTGRLAARQRWQARSRARTGSHLPHPGLAVSRTAAWEHRFARPTPAFVDGRAIGAVAQVRAWVEPDSFVLVV